CAATFDLIAPTAPRTLLLWNSAAGDPLGNGQSDVYNTTNALWTATVALDGRIDVQVKGIGATERVMWTLEFAPPKGEQLQVGRRYTDAAQFAAAGVPGMNISGNGASCGGDGDFTVRQLTFADPQTVSTLAIDFEMHCGLPSIPPTPPVMGTIEFNAIV